MKGLFCENSFIFDVPLDSKYASADSPHKGKSVSAILLFLKNFHFTNEN